MKISSLLLSWVVAVSLTACTDAKKAFSLGGSAYQVPADYLVISPSSFESTEFDDNISMVALTFNNDKDFSDYMEPNSWLPGSSITAILYAREGTSLTGFSPSFSSLVEFPVDGENIIEFENSYRIFQGDTRISWQALPKPQTSFDGEKVTAKWMADCIPLGGMRGSEQSHESIDIPTSCKINIEYRNSILRLSTSEKNLLDNAEEITALMLQKLDSWRVHP